MGTRRSYLKNQRGVTLLEISATLVILTLLTVLLYPRLNGIFEKSQVDVVESDFRLMKSSVQQFFVDHRGDTFDQDDINEYLDYEFKKNTSVSGVDKYETLYKKDPWGKPYYLYVKNTGNSYVAIHSYGPDNAYSMNNTTMGDDLLVIFYPKE